jgi:demethylmenaquinone methyltransferase/2-methoxy-6-polyprenyl-1,4-benzoquinol methylase
MANLKGDERARYVQEMFTRIAPRYDFMNRLMTAGQDIRWRQEVIRRANLHSGAYVLDLGSGTGDLAREALRQCPDCRSLAADFTLQMMRIGQRRPINEEFNGKHLYWTAADSLHLPFPDTTFEAVISGFLMRNVRDVRGALQEQFRVLKPGGQIVILDTTRPPKNLLSPLIRFYTNAIIPFLGRLITGHADAYTYLPESTTHFLSAENLAKQMAMAGFKNTGFKRRMLGVVAIHWGEK